MTARHRFAFVTAAMTWFALAVQLNLTVGRAPPGVEGIVTEIGKFFGYFTILTNLMVATVMTAIARGNGRPLTAWHEQPRVAGALVIYSTIMLLVYEVMLRGLWHPAGIEWLADLLLHDAVPVACLTYFIAFVPRGGLRWQDPVVWLVYPVTYSIYAFVRGALTNWYPYPFVDVNALGVLPALRNATFVVLAFCVVGLLFVAADRALARARPVRD